MRDLKRLFTFLLLSSALAGSAVAQGFVLKVNPISAVVRTVNVQTEFGFNHMMSVQMGGYYTFYSGNAADIFLNYRGWGVTPEFRYYLTNKSRPAPEGFFMGPFLRFTRFSIDDDGANEVTVRCHGGGLIMGYQAIAADAVAIDMFFGLGGGSFNITEDEELTADELFFIGSGIITRFGISIGGFIPFD